MALDKFTHELVIDVASDSGGKLKEFERPRDTSRVKLDGIWQRIHGGNFTIPISTGEALDLGDVPSPAKGLYIEVNNDCDIVLNGLASPIQVRRVPAQATLPTKLFLEVDITSVLVTALGTNVVEGTYRVWGDETPAAP